MTSFILWGLAMFARTGHRDPRMDALEKSYAVIEFKPDGTILRANDNFLKTLGYSADEVGLPGYPDNLEFDPETGLIWIALPSPRSAELDGLHPNPFIKRLAWRWIQIAGLPPLPPTPAMALAVTTGGEPVYALLGPDDRGSGITTATPWNGALYVSGLERDGVDVYAVPDGIVGPRPAEPEPDPSDVQTGLEGSPAPASEPTEQP